MGVLLCVYDIAAMKMVNKTIVLYMSVGRTPQGCGLPGAVRDARIPAKMAGGLPARSGSSRYALAPWMPC